MEREKSTGSMLLLTWYADNHVNQICLHWHWLIVLNVMKVLTHVISFHLILSFGLIFNDGTVESTFYHEILWLKWNILYNIVIFKMIKITLIWMLILVISCGTFIFSYFNSSHWEFGWVGKCSQEVCKYGLHPIGFLDDHIEYLINDK